MLATVPALLIGALTWPMLFTDSPLGGDWAHHLSWVWTQATELDVNHRPSLFLNYSHAVLYPQYAFYGATLYAITGSLSLLFGDAPIATYVFTYLLGFAAAYGGWYWMARMAGLGRWLAQVPGLIFITSAYYLTLIYERGDWPEFIAVSTIPLLIASGVGVLRAERQPLLPTVALAGSAVIFFGSHSLTAIWGSTLIVLLTASAVLCVPPARRWLRPRRARRAVAVLLPALVVNAWFLLPAVVYQAHTKIAQNYAGARGTLQNFMPMVSAANLFTIDRTDALSEGGAFAVTLPVLAIAWTALGMILLLRSGLGSAWARVLCICAGLTALMAIVMTHASLILALPRPYAMLQFSYRLDSYVLLALSGAMLAVLALAKDRARFTRLLSWALVPVVVVAVVGAVGQTDDYPRVAGSRQTAVRPASQPGPREEGWSDYVDVSLPLLPRVGRIPEIYFPPAALRHDRASRAVGFSSGLAYTNIGGGPDLVHVTGARIVGRDPEGNDVLEVEPGAARAKGVARPGDAGARPAGAGARPGGAGSATPTQVVSVSPAAPLPVTLGRLLTLIAVLFLAGELLVLAGRRRNAAARDSAHAE